ncbi:MAG: hypothetical protein KF700_06270 [Hyphomonadaceae bacterium]|nr:hypothetical protein [Hyphomonadaceae bacterium]
MSIWLLVAAFASIGATALLASLLWRLNAPQSHRREAGGDDAPIPHSDTGDGGDGGGD